MDDTRPARPRAWPAAAARRSFGAATAALTLACSLTGCSLFVMAGKMLSGDPTIPCAFTSATRVDLTAGEATVLVVCSAPEAVRSEFPGLHLDLLDGVTRRLTRQGVQVVSPDDVASWLEDNGGALGRPTEIAEQLKADYVIHVELEQFTWQEENSPTLMRGRTWGRVTAHHVRGADGRRLAARVFEREYTSEYPQHQPVSIEQVSPKLFRKRYLDRICTELAQMFYDYRVSEVIF